MARHLLLKNGGRIPTLGLGTYQLKNSEGQKAIDIALFNGYRHIDTARRYGNEHDIGEVINSKIKLGGLKRDGLFITTKLPSAHLAGVDVKPSLEQSLDALQTTYVDMFLIHYPWGNRNRGDGNLTPLIDEKGPIDGDRELADYDLCETWAAMEDLVDSGKVRAIGLSNFSAQLIENIWQNSRIKPSNLQCECHAYLQQTALSEYCKSRGIIMTAYAPLGAQSLPSRPPSQPIPLEDEVVQDLARKHKRTTGQVLLRHLLQKDIVVIPKSASEKRTKENGDIYDFELTERDMQQLNSLDRNLKFYTFNWAKKHSLFVEGAAF